MKRSEFLRMMSLAAGGVMLGARCSYPKKKIPGRMLSSGSAAAHLLRTGKFPEASETIAARVLVVGSGVAGLSAMRILRKNNFTDALLLELDDHTGGNCASGKNEVSAYPWGAHYLPVPSLAYPELIQFLKDSGKITGTSASGLPKFCDEDSCIDPQERLFYHNTWQDELVPSFAASKTEREESERFHRMMREFRAAEGSDGKKAFMIPVDFSSQDEKFLALDQITMKTWMQQQGFHSEPLHWYVNYCCRDDYGTSYDNVSAWAGIHYYASRRHILTEHDDDTVLTWPEGNAHLANHLLEAAGKDRIRTNSLVYKIGSDNGKLYALYYDVIQKKSIRANAEKIILAVPHFVAAKLLKDFPETVSAETFSYAPWMVANITVNNWPSEIGQQLSWDNVIYGTESIGYVDACHQDLRVYRSRRVLTYYHPLSHKSPSEARLEASKRTHEQWVDMILSDLSVAHAAPASYIDNIDIWLWGHGMIRPLPGFISGEARRKAKIPLSSGIHFAHSDLSGISIFEEAFYQGHRAAEEVLAALNHTA